MAGQHADKQQLKPFEKALRVLALHPLLGPVAKFISFEMASKNREWAARALPRDAYCQLVGHKTVVYNDALKVTEQDWLGVFSIACLALALDAPNKLEIPSPFSDQAAQLAALHWWRSIKLGSLPERFNPPEDLVVCGRLSWDDLMERLHAASNEQALTHDWSLGGVSGMPWLQPKLETSARRSHYQIKNPIAQDPTPAQCFVKALVDSAKRTLQAQQDPSVLSATGTSEHSNTAKAKRWLIAHYPLLGALVSQFDLIEDAEICRRMNISIAAVHVRLGEIYINPLRNLSFENSKFVLAHEVLHAGLSHSRRRQGRDPFLWNVACDFVINDWLVGLGVGIAPDSGLLFDPELRGWPAEDIYLRLSADLRTRRKLQTLRGGEVDMLDDSWPGGFTDKEDFYRYALLQGLDYHQSAERGLLPAGLVEAIRTLNHAPIAWQTKLAEWLREHFPLPERQRTYARASRRQSATPDIARPRFYEPEQERSTRTFGVIIDTSGSMNREVLGLALGAVVSYSRAQNVKAVRLVYCDAQAYDEGYIEIDSLAHRVQMRGRGGTQLQPAVSLLEGQCDFPKEAPILIITDGQCEGKLEVRHDHAFLLPPGKKLPFVTRKPVFYMS